VVHHTAEAERGAGQDAARRALIGGRLRTVIAVVCAAATLTACGGSSPSRQKSSTTATSPAGASGATVRTARCMLWNVLDPAGRRSLVVGLRAFFSQPLDTGAHLRLIPDGRAYKVIDAYCRLPFARAFLIYRLYGNAIGFSSNR
jgi:hypothetical protein